MNSFKSLSPIAALLLGVALAAAVNAQSVQDETVKIAFSGEITALDTGAKTISVTGANGEKGVFAIGPETSILSGSQKKDMASLVVGDWIVIDANQKGDQKLATYIEVVDGPDPAAGAASAEATAAGSEVAVNGDALTPALVQIGAGQSVTFRNAGKSGAVTVVADDGSLSSPALEPGKSWSHSFDVPGVYPIHVKENAKAKGSVVVE